MGGPGSLIWLAAADARLRMRAISDVVGGRLTLRALIVVFAAVGMLLMLVRPVGRWIAAAAADPAQAAALDGAALLWIAVVLPWTASHALTGATRALYGGGDLDLLLTSPLPPARILAARTIAIYLEAVLAVAVFLAPLIISAVWFAGPRWLALAPALLALGLIGVAFGVTCALALFAIVGPRRARQIAQAMAMLIGVSFVALLQALSFLPSGFEATLSGFAATANGESLPILLQVPIEAAQGDLRALIVLAGAGVLALAATSRLLGPLFVSAALGAAGAPAHGTQAGADPGRGPAFPASAAGALRVKEWKLLYRDPWLMGHLAMQAMYTLPIVLALWRLQPGDEAMGLLLGPATVIILAQLAASLAWVAVSSEDAPDLMAAAPVSPAEQMRHKLEALAAPLLALLAPVAVGLAFIAPADAAIVIVCAIAGAASTALVNVWRPQPARRSAMHRRHAQSKMMALVEHLLAILWCMTTLFALQDKIAWSAMAGAAILTLWLMRPERRRAQSRLAKPVRGH